MAKIFLSFQNGIASDVSDSVIPCFYESLIKGLIDAGNDVMVYHAWGMPYGNRPNDAEKIVESLKFFAPDLVMAFNNYGPDYSKWYDGPIVIYEVDSPIYYENKDCITGCPNRYSYCINQIESKEILVKKYGVSESRIRLVPFFTEIQAKSCDKDINVSFVGSRFYGANLHWHDYRNVNPSCNALQRYKLLIQELRSDPFCNVESLCKRYEDMKLTPWDVNAIISSLSTEKRVKVLSSIADLGLALYGTEEWLESRDSDFDLYCSYNPTKIYSLQQNQDLYNRSKVCLNVNHLQAISGFSWRVCDIMASSGCLVTEKKDNLDIYFPNVPIPTFSDRFECRKQVLRVLESPAMREDVTAACQKAIESGFRFRHVLPIIEASVGLDLSSGKGLGKLSFVEHSQDRFVVPTKKKKNRRWL